MIRIGLLEGLKVRDGGEIIGERGGNVGKRERVRIFREESIFWLPLPSGSKLNILIKVTEGSILKQSRGAPLPPPPDLACPLLSLLHLILFHSP